MSKEVGHEWKHRLETISDKTRGCQLSELDKFERRMFEKLIQIKKSEKKTEVG